MFCSHCGQEVNKHTLHQLLAKEDGGVMNSRGVIIMPGDRIKDPMFYHVRQVSHVIEDTLYMMDGGVMDAEEVTWEMFEVY